MKILKKILPGILCLGLIVSAIQPISAASNSIKNMSRIQKIQKLE